MLKILEISLFRMDNIAMRYENAKGASRSPRAL